MATSTSTEEDLAQRLPYDLLADVLRRLETAPRVLAVARRVCKAWRAVVDARGLPLSVSGIFTHPNNEALPDYFALPPHQQPSSTQIPTAAFDRLDTDGAYPLLVEQHCNGLLLMGNGESWRVLNPTTGQWARLPSPPPLCFMGNDDHYYEKDRNYDCEDGLLVFDPVMSPHYQVLLINSIPFTPSPDCQFVRTPTKAREWPPSPYTLRVFSSETRLWEKKQFTRQGEARGTIHDMLWCPHPHYCYEAYWQGALYVHQRDFIMKMNLSDYTYQVAMLPTGEVEGSWPDWYLGKSNAGVYCALLKGYGSPFGLQVWFLDETSCGQMKWDLKRDVDLHHLLASFPSDHGDGPSTIQCAQEHDMSNATRGISAENYVRRTLSMLGFHPNKEVIFIRTPSKRVMAYQFNNSSEAEDLGYLSMDQVPPHRMYCSFSIHAMSYGRVIKQLLA